MRFGIREICDVVFRAKSKQKLGNRTFYKNEPVLYFDTLKTSTLEGAATTVYATGGRGNNRLIAWEGERTLTFTMEDALLSPESLSILTGAGLMEASKEAPIYVHQTSQIEVKTANTIELPTEACWTKYPDVEPNVKDEYQNDNADIFIMVLDDAGEMSGEPCIPAAVNQKDHKTITCYGHEGMIPVGTIVLVDYYVKRTGGAQMIEITADKFGGSYYVEASTLFRREGDNVDMPAEFVIPNAKVQSNFTFSMASTGDPSTFTFTMDAFPDYTKFDHTHKILAGIQVIYDEDDGEDGSRQPCVPFKTPDYETGEAGYGTMKVKDLYADNVVVTPDEKETGKYHVTGDFKPIDSWPELPHSSWQSNSISDSAFYVVEIPEQYKGHRLEIFLNGSSKTSGEIKDQELFWVFNVTDKPASLKIEIDGVLFADFDFSKINILESE